MIQSHTIDVCSRRVNIYFRKGGNVLPGVCLSVCLSVC